MPAARAAPRPTPVPLAPEAAYRALQTHDSRFDGRLFVGVTSTGIYCRPVCRVRLPQARNCRYFDHAALAEQAGFRPCLRCRPELAPGLSRTDSSRALAHAGARCIDHAVAQGEVPSLPAIASRLGVTDRHFRRVFQAAYGVSPVAWLTTQRLLLAKRLLTDTHLPVTQVAAASGYDSLRRFHAAFADHYRMPPTALRRSATSRTARPAGERDETATIRLAWRPPYDAPAMQAFLAARPLPGVERVDDQGWHRSLALHHQGRDCRGWLSLRFRPEQGEVQAQVSAGLAPALGSVIERLRHLLDLDTDTAPIDAMLADLPGGARPGQRVPGCIDGFETTVRIILGQQVTVAAACTLAGRLVQRFGEPLATGLPGLDRLFPSPAALADATPDAIGTLGIVRTRVAALQAVARAVRAGQLALHPTAPMAETLALLRSLPGIGDWTTELVALRVMAWPDAFPATDAGVIQALGGQRPPASLARAEAWRPWRAYAVTRLWHGLASAAPATAAPPASRASAASPASPPRSPTSSPRSLT